MKRGEKATLDEVQRLSVLRLVERRRGFSASDGCVQVGCLGNY